MSSIFKTMKPDPVFASMLGSVPRFTPNVGVGSETNKFGEKYEKIKKFVSEPYWRVEADMRDDNGRTHRMKWCRGKIFDKTVV